MKCSFEGLIKCLLELEKLNLSGKPCFTFTESSLSPSVHHVLFMHYIPLVCLCSRSACLELIPRYRLPGDTRVSAKYLKSKTSVCMPVFTCLSRACLVSKGQRGRPTFRGSNNNGVQLLCQHLQRAVFSQSTFHPHSPRCFFPLVKTHPGSEEHFPSLWPC